MKKLLLSTVAAATLLSTSTLAENKSSIEGLEISGEFSIASNHIDRGETLTSKEAGGSGAIAFDYQGMTAEFATFSVDNDTEIDSALTYTQEIANGVEAYVSYLNIRTTSTTGTQGEEYSIGLSTSINGTDLGYDYITDPDTTFNINQVVVGRSYGDIGVEALYGIVDADAVADEHNYYQVSISYPCSITTGEWSFIAADTDKSGVKPTYAIAHTFSF